MNCSNTDTDSTLIRFALLDPTLSDILHLI